MRRDRRTARWIDMNGVFIELLKAGEKQIQSLEFYWYWDTMYLYIPLGLSMQLWIAWTNDDKIIGLVMPRH